ncbi:MAG: adenosine deaminase family protein [Clostridiales Family XIII bacterium]|jgi:adenosine deaminase|nr:adenosine deaminase family protein [Clostridiales Family XIII bacterium]
MADFLRDLFRAMPKAELHMHLDGALEVKTAIELMTGRAPDAKAPDGGGTECPKNAAGGAFRAQSYEALYRRLVIDGPLATQAALLGRYDLPIELLQSEEALERVTDDLLRAKAADRVRYCEIRWAPALHCAGGLGVRRVVESVARATKRACARYGILARLIVVGMRFHAPRENVSMLRQAAEADARGLLAAADLAGPEAAHPDPTVQQPFFDAARRLGLGLTLHCGELPSSADAIRRCVLRVAPDRIAHGSGAAADESLCALLAERGIRLDLCPTSNIQAGLYADYADFPVATLFRRGVPVSISTDSPVISGLTLSEEYYRTAAGGRLGPAELWAINLASLDSIFAEDAVKRALKAEFRAWAHGVSELCPDASRPD